MRVMSKSTSAQTFAKIFELFIRGATAEEKAAAKRKMDAWLKRHGKTEADIPAILAQAGSDNAAAQPPPPSSDPRDTGTPGPIGRNITPLDLIHALFQDYIVADKFEHVAMALWSAHTHVFDQFEHTPRLLPIGPVRSCGKTTVLKVLDRMVARPEPVLCHEHRPSTR